MIERKETPLSLALKERIRRDGPLPFIEFMRAALLDPVHGYYSRGPDIGPEGDFSTSARFPAFGFALARFVERAGAALGRSDVRVLELGGGTGELARHVRGHVDRHLDAHVGFHVSWAFDDASSALLARQRSSSASSAGHSASSAFPSFDIVFGNEVLDALPVRRVVGGADGALLEIHVALDDRGEFRERLLPLADTTLSARLTRIPSKGQVVEFRPDLDAFVARAASRLGEIGYVVFVDYGDGSDSLFDPSGRWNGTLAAYRAHEKVADVYDAVGEQDLTADVDFTALERAALAAGLEPAGSAFQGAWLDALGIAEYAEETGDSEAADAVAMLRGAARLGSAFRVAAFAKGDAPTPAPGF